MKNSILIFALLLLFVAPSNGQITLAHSYAGDSLTELQVVNLSHSGKKLALMTYNWHSTNADTIFYYNLDYSLWKIIPWPAIPGFYKQTTFGVPGVGVNYSSESLFNEDTLLEAAVNYISITNANRGKVMIINENGIMIDSITGIIATTFVVHRLNTNTFVAIAQTPTGPQVYNLTGTLPCDSCSSSTTLGMAKAEEKSSNILSAPIPNPSNNQVKITFTLPDGAIRGQLTIYNTNGQQMKSYTVDRRFGFVLVDDSQFAPGMYYYNLTANGTVSYTQKMVVIK